MANSEDDAMLGAYVAAAEAKGLSAFLASGQTDQAFDSGQLFNPRLDPILKAYFGPAFNQAFGRAVAAQDQQAVGRMVLWKAESAGISPSELYQDAYRNLDTKIESLAGTVDAYLRDPRSPEARNLKGMKAFEDSFPKALVSTLPPYFTDLTNKLADRLTPYIIRLNNERNNPRMALALTKSILRLDYLSEDKRTNLKKIGRQLRDNVNVARQNREAQSSGGSSVGSYIWMIIVFVVMIFRIGSCVSRSNSYSSRPSYRTTSPYTYQPQAPSAQTFKTRFVYNLRSAVASRTALQYITPDHRAKISTQLLLPIQRPGAGVVEANMVLRGLREDTIYHVEGHLMNVRRTPFDVDKVFEQMSTRAPVKKLRKEMEKANQLSQEEKAKARQARLAAKKAAELSELAALGAKAFHKESKDDILGPKARMPANYSLLLKTTASTREKLFRHGPIKKIKVGVDDAEVGAVLVWRDTFGLRQIRLSSTLSIPLVFKVATGKINKLTDGYVVYGKRWSDQETSPWGGEGWYKEVLCYCGPDDHEAFINGKKISRKNLWLPSKKIDPKKSMSPNAWLRGVKRLR